MTTPAQPSAARQIRQLRVGVERFLDPFQAERGLQGESSIRAQRPRFAGHHREVVDRQAIVTPVAAEDLADHPELERREAVEHHHGHVLQHVVHDAF